MEGVKDREKERKDDDEAKGSQKKDGGTEGERRMCIVLSVK